MADLALGTVQLGLPYGAANTTGMPTEAQACDIVREAVAGGVRELDTAHGYDLSQQRLGAALRACTAAGLPAPHVVTKLDVAIQEAATADEVAALVDASVANSRDKLGISPVHTVCLHWWAKHGPSLHGGAAYERLKQLKADGAIERIGTSTYDPPDVLEALADPATEHIQLPFNLLDYRWREAGVSAALAKRPDVTVHARSCFLQGILPSPMTDPWPARFGRELARTMVDAIGGLVTELGRKNRADLCLAYARAQPWVTAVLVGAETVEQVRELLELCKLPPLTPDEVARVDAAVPRAPPELLNPGKWHDKPSFAGSYATGLLGPEGDAGGSGAGK